MAVNLKIKELIDILGLSKTAFAKRVGTSHSNINKLYALESEPGGALIERIVSEFGVNPMWLFTDLAESVFLSPGQKPAVLTHPPLPKASGDSSYEVVQGYQASEAGGFGAITIRLRNDAMALPQSPDWIPLVPLRAQAGYIQDYAAGSHSYNEIKLLYVPNLTNGTGTGMLRAFEVEGDSMENTFKNGDIVVGERLMSPKQIVPEKVYVLVTHTNILVKRVYLGADGQLSLESDNQDYKPQTLPLTEVREMWREVGALLTSERRYPKRQ